MGIEAQPTTPTATPDLTPAPQAPAPVGGAAPAAPPAAEPPKALTLPDGTDPSEEATYQLSGADFKRRLARYTSKQLRDQFGTDNPDEIKAKLAEYEQLKAKQEEQRRASMDETTRLQEDLAREKAARQAAEQARAQLETRIEVSRETRRIKAIASKHVDPSMMEFALPKLAAHLKANYSRAEINRLKDGDIERFFADLAKKNPRFAKAGQPRPATPPPPRVPVTNGRPAGAAPRPPAGGPAPKSAAPGPNQMSRDEIKKNYGVSW
jgi:hypothetical protein